MNPFVRFGGTETMWAVPKCLCKPQADLFREMVERVNNDYVENELWHGDQQFFVMKTLLPVPYVVEVFDHVRWLCTSEGIALYIQYAGYDEYRFGIIKKEFPEVVQWSYPPSYQRMPSSIVELDHAMVDQRVVA